MTHQQQPQTAGQGGVSACACIFWFQGCCPSPTFPSTRSGLSALWVCPCSLRAMSQSLCLPPALCALPVKPAPSDTCTPNPKPLKQCTQKPEFQNLQITNLRPCNTHVNIEPLTSSPLTTEPSNLHTTLSAVRDSRMSFCRTLRTRRWRSTGRTTGWLHFGPTVTQLRRSSPTTPSK